MKENDDFGPNTWAHFHCVSFLPETWQDVDSKAVIDLDLKNKLSTEEAYWKIRKERVDLQCIVCKKKMDGGKNHLGQPVRSVAMKLAREFSRHLCFSV